MYLSRATLGFALGIVLWFAAAATTWAEPLVWTLNVTFTDGGTATGVFTLDADTGVLSNWNISATGGNTSLFFPFTFAPANSIEYFQGGSMTAIAFDSNASFVNGEPLILQMITAAALTDAGGVVQIQLGDYSVECFDCNPYRSITRGTLTASVAPPFGSFDIPTDGETGLAGEVNVGGWALSTLPVTVQIWRDPVPNETPAANGLVFVGDTTFIAGTRPDIAAAYPGYPNSNAAGWGAQILSNELPHGGGNGPIGNGTYTLHALATDADGGITDLGAHTITVNNAASLLPFGTIDTPAAGATISGTAYVNFGWALTPQPNMIPINGSTINVFIDNKPMGHPVYNNPRSDIEALFPGYANTDGAVGYLKINTTTLSNGLHQISWGVTDNAGHKNGIGSRYFFVQN